MAELNDAVELEDEECQPLSSLVRVDVEPAASAWRSAHGKDREDLAVQIQLLSYGGEGAADVFGQIDPAVDDCAVGFTIDPIVNSSALSVGPLDPPAVAEASTSYRRFEATGPSGNASLELWSCVVVARAGHELLLFQTKSLLDDVCSSVPAAVVAAQLEWYADAVG